MRGDRPAGAFRRVYLRERVADKSTPHSHPDALEEARGAGIAVGSVRTKALGGSALQASLPPGGNSLPLAVPRWLSAADG